MVGVFLLYTKVMKHFEQTYTIEAPIEKVWQALVKPEIINQWSGGPAEMKAEEGSKFSFWGGDIFGTNTKVVAGKLLEQDWYSDKEWKSPSKVTFSLKSDGDKTIVHLTHANIPDEEARDIEAGWKDYYLGPIKKLLEDKTA
jgi:uncharacterized protein YndB with AHSA1/START domain